MNKHTVRDRANAIRCPHCGGSGASLAQACPGQQMTEAQSQAVNLGTLDFRNGRWVEVANSAYAFMLLLAEGQAIGTASSRQAEIDAVLAASDYHVDATLGCIPKKPLVIPHVEMMGAAY